MDPAAIGMPPGDPAAGGMPPGDPAAGGSVLAELKKYHKLLGLYID
jgi:hypothetical protein